MNELLDKSIMNGIDLHTRTSESQDQRLLELFQNCNNESCTLRETSRKCLWGFWYAGIRR